VRETPVSTFSIDVDPASYSFVRASLNRSVLPLAAEPAGGGTDGEFINYSPTPTRVPPRQPNFRTTVSIFPSPWSEGRRSFEWHHRVCGSSLQADARKPGF